MLKAMIVLWILFSTIPFTLENLGYEPSYGVITPRVKLDKDCKWIDYSIDCITFDIYPTKTNSIIDRAISRFHKNTFHDRSLVPPVNAPAVTHMVLDIENIDTPLFIGVNESYLIKFDGPVVTLRSSTTWGALRGLESFSQMVHQRFLDDKYVVVPMTIEDYPALNYRAIVLDAATAYLRIETIEKFIESMSYLKYNVLVLQITNNENFGFTSKKYPELHQKRGIYGNIFPHDTLIHLIDYAYERGIIIDPQFRLPESSSSWGSIDRIVVSCNAFVYEKPLVQINPILEEAVDIVADVLIEAASTFNGTYLHLAYNPSNYTCWKENQEIREYAKIKGYQDEYKALDVEFLVKVEKKVRSYYKGVVYPASLINSVYPIPKGAIVLLKQLPDSIEDIKKIIAMGYNIIFAGCYNLTMRIAFTWFERFLECPMLLSHLTKEEATHIFGGAGYIDSPADTTLLTRVWNGGFAVADGIWNAERFIDPYLARARYHELDCKFWRRHIPSRNLSPSTYCRFPYTEE